MPRFLNGSNYDYLCGECRSTIDSCVELVTIGPDTDDEEAPCNLAYDLGMLCGGHRCAWHRVNEERERNGLPPLPENAPEIEEARRRGDDFP